MNRPYVFNKEEIDFIYSPLNNKIIHTHILELQKENAEIKVLLNSVLEKLRSGNHERD